MKMNRIIIYLSIIPWVFYYSINIFKTLIDLDHKSIFSLFRFDSIILICLFIYFSKFNKIFVIEMLFATMNLYFFVNRLYEDNMHIVNIKKVFSENKLLLFLLHILALVIIIVCSRILKLNYFYYMLFAISFFINIVIYTLKKMKLFK